LKIGYYTWASEGVERLYNKELYDLCSSPNNIWVSKSRIKRWVGYVACMGERRVADLRKREHLEDIGINGRSGMGRQGQDLTG
jgi:hypothetical protein